MIKLLHLTVLHTMLEEELQTNTGTTLYEGMYRDCAACSKYSPLLYNKHPIVQSNNSPLSCPTM